LGIGVCRSSVVRFSNENMLVQIEENVRGADVFVIQPSCPPVSDGIIELLMTIDALRHASAGRITAVLPYFPYARSDKKDRPRVSITARLMADLLQTAGANRVLTMDLHSPQVQGFPRGQLRPPPSCATTSVRAATSRTTCSSPATWANRKRSVTTRTA
jgi:ribose-phosphate pyrophosphokinase